MIEGKSFCEGVLGVGPPAKGMVLSKKGLLTTEQN